MEHRYREPFIEHTYGSSSDEDTTYPLKIDTKPKIIDGYLYRPSSGSHKGKPKSYPIQSYATDKPSKGTPKEEKVPKQRGVDREPTPPPQNNIIVVLEVLQEVLQVEDPQVKDPQMVMVVKMIKIKIKRKMTRKRKKKILKINTRN